MLSMRSQAGFGGVAGRGAPGVSPIACWRQNCSKRFFSPETTSVDTHSEVSLIKEEGFK